MNRHIWFVGAAPDAQGSPFLNHLYTRAGVEGSVQGLEALLASLARCAPGGEPMGIVLALETDTLTWPEGLIPRLLLSRTRVVCIASPWPIELAALGAQAHWVPWAEGAGEAHLRSAIELLVSRAEGDQLQDLLDERAVDTLVLRHRLQRAQDRLKLATQRLASQEQDYQRLRRQDPVTGLSNRAALMFRLSEELELAQREDGHTFCLALLNLRRFKVVNGSLGSRQGDKLLGEVGTRLGQGIRRGDMVARLGSDEFAMVVSGVDEAEARRLTQRLLDDARVGLTVGGRGFPIVASMGAVVAGSRYARPDEILRDAGVALARGRGVDGVAPVFFDPSCHLDDRIRLELEADILRGLEREEFNLVYQPVIDVRTGLVAGFEGLLRWSHPKYGAVGPNLFIPVAEISGLILPLGEWILERGCRDFVSLRAERGVERLFLSLNVSRHELFRPDYPATVAQSLRRYGVTPSDLRLEVTETACVESGGRLIGNLNELKAMGIRVLIDDFGVGQSSLGELYRLPIDGLKVDRAFVVAAHLPRGQALLRAIVAMGHALGLSVIAEGIEDEGQLHRIAAAGCEYAQGFLFGRGMGLEEARLVLRAQGSMATPQLAG